MSVCCNNVEYEPARATICRYRRKHDRTKQTKQPAFFSFNCLSTVLCHTIFQLRSPAPLLEPQPPHPLVPSLLLRLVSFSLDLCTLYTQSHSPAPFRLPVGPLLLQPQPHHPSTPLLPFILLLPLRVPLLPKALPHGLHQVLHVLQQTVLLPAPLEKDGALQRDAGVAGAVRVE